MSSHYPLVCYTFACKWHQTSWWLHHWPWMVGALAVIGAVAVAVSRKR